MMVLRNSLFLVALSLVAAACSSGNSSDGKAEDSLVAGANNQMDELEAFKDEFGVTKGGDTGIPEPLPKDLYVTDDMKIDLTIENDLMSQVRYHTGKSYDELVELYRDYLSNNPSLSDYEENIDASIVNGFAHALFIVIYEGNTTEVNIIEDESIPDIRSVDVILYNDQAVDEMIEEMQRQMED